MKKHRRTFNAEFKQEAVELVRHSGRSETQIAKELGLTSSVLNRWVRQAQDARPGENRFATRDDIRRLEKEVARLRMERDILKKATAFFAKDSI